MPPSARCSRRRQPNADCRARRRRRLRSAGISRHGRLPRTIPATSRTRPAETSTPAGAAVRVGDPTGARRCRLGRARPEKVRQQVRDGAQQPTRWVPSTRRTACRTRNTGRGRPRRRRPGMPVAGASRNDEDQVDLCCRTSNHSSSAGEPSVAGGRVIATFSRSDLDLGGRVRVASPRSQFGQPVCEKSAPARVVETGIRDDADDHDVTSGSVRREPEPGQGIQAEAQCQKPAPRSRGGALLRQEPRHTSAARGSAARRCFGSEARPTRSRRMTRTATLCSRHEQKEKDDSLRHASRELVVHNIATAVVARIATHGVRRRGSTPRHRRHQTVRGHAVQQAAGHDHRQERAVATATSADRTEQPVRHAKVRGGQRPPGAARRRGHLFPRQHDRDRHPHQHVDGAGVSSAPEQRPRVPRRTSRTSSAMFAEVSKRDEPSSTPAARRQALPSQGLGRHRTRADVRARLSPRRARSPPAPRRGRARLLDHRHQQVLRRSDSRCLGR